MTRIVWQAVAGELLMRSGRENLNQILNLFLVCPTDEVHVRKETERCLERRKQEQENTNKQQSVGT